MTKTSKLSEVLRLRLTLHGAVQGVGFRPFVYRLAVQMGLKGCVVNSSQGVYVEAEGDTSTLDTFVKRLINEKPPRAYIQGMETAFLDPIGFSDFAIRDSDLTGERSALVLPDIATCPECLNDIFDPGNRRHLYPFTNCTNCGPRYSIIRALPYDRPNTTMAAFNMCEECKAEYENPYDRRFHAQPIACPRCGPRLQMWDTTGRIVESDGAALFEAADSIRKGKIVALKGIGGFQLLVDARNDDAVKRLRSRKHREEKPFALMYPSFGDLEDTCEVSDLEKRLLNSPESPIVLLRRRPDLTSLSPSIAPRNPYLGAMLPYTPLHHMLMRELGFPIVATSGNLSDEPICLDEREALKRLGCIADLFLVHDRPIERQVDDSVVRMMAGRTQIVRRARGYAPFPIEIQNRGFGTQKYLAVGGHLKNTVAINVGENIFVSQHIGDLSTGEAYQAFEQVTHDFKKLYDVSPETIVHDLHPDYLSTHFAAKTGGRKLGVQHHFAHVAACMAENGLDGKVLGVSWDGTGYGEDGTVWGGEFFVADGCSYRRVATFRRFRLPGGTAAVKEPRRTALGVLWEVYGEGLFTRTDLAPVQAFDSSSLTVLGQMLQSGLNSPLTSSAGRLFDAVSSIVGIRQISNFEGQGAMELEFALGGESTGESYLYEVKDNGTRESGDRRQESGVGRLEPADGRSCEPALMVDWELMIEGIVSDVSAGVRVARIAEKFHNTLCDIIVDIVKRIGEPKVALSGGCFQNKYLTERTVDKLTREGFKPYWHQRVPPNDGGISLGQMFVALNENSRKRDGKDKLLE